MSIWNRIGDVASTVAKGVETGAINALKFGGEIAGGIAGAARFGWDVGTAPWNNADEYNGFVQTFKTAYNKESANIIKPLASAGGAIMKVPGVAPAIERINKINQEYIREPLTTANLVVGDITAGRVGLGGFFDPNEWKKAYTGAQDISFGQSVLNQYRVIYDPKFNIYDPSQRDTAFKNSAWGKGLSGFFDFGVQAVGDVSLAAGKGLKALKVSGLGVNAIRTADDAALAAEDITRAQYGIENKYSKLLKDFTDNNSAYALAHPMVRSSANPGLLAHFLGDSVDVDETALILRSALGDPAARDELKLQRAYITDALDKARGDLSAVDEWKLYSAPDGSGMIPFLNDKPAVAEEAIKNYESLAKTDKYFADLWSLSEAGGVLTRTTGYGLQGAEDFIAKARATKYYDKAVGNPRIEIYQPTPFHRLYQKISWAAGERPGGLVDFNDPDSYKEFTANINQAQKLLNLSPEESKKLLDSYISAATPEQRFTATINFEGKMFRALGEKYGLTEEEATKLYNLHQGARTSALKSIKDKGFMVDLNEEILKVPQLESQTADYLPLADFALLDKILKRNKSGLKAVLGKPVDTTLHVMDFMQDWFKAGALLRLGYTQRNAIDSQLRIAASVGSMATLRHLGPGLKNILNNTVQVPARLVDRYLPVEEGMTLAKVQKTSNSIVKELSDLKTKIGELEAKLTLNPSNTNVSGELNTLKSLEQEKLAAYNHYAEVLNRAPKAKPKARIATGSYKVTLSDGSVYELPDAFGGPLGDMWRKLASSGNSFERMVDGNTDMYLRQLSSKGIGVVRPTDPGYFEQWAQTLRQQFGNSAVVKKIIAGEDVDSIARWLKSSPDGRDLRKRLAIPSDESAEYVTKISGFLDQYLPIESGLRPKLAEITANDLRSTFKDPRDLPVIHGHVLEENINNVGRIQGRKIINQLFHLLGTLPEDTWARNPLYVYFYRKEAARRLDIMSGMQVERVSAEDQAKIMALAHKSALREMKNILFNIERKTNLAAAMKYISPFFSAQENAYKTWLKMAVANPVIVNRGYLVWNAPNKAGLVTDQEGKEVPNGKTSGNDIIWLGVPKGLRGLPGLGSLTKLGIPKQSLDVIFQGGLDVLYNKGNPNVFSDIFPVGPYVGVPVSEIVKRQPSLEDSFKFVLPFGPSKDPLSAFLPTWVQKEEILRAGQDDPQFARTYQLIWNTEQMKAKRNNLPPVSDSKVLKMTQDYWKMRTFASLIMPFAPRFDSPYKFYLDKSREYRRLYGLEADARFLQDFPEYFQFASSLSSNPAGIQSSVQAVSNLNKYSGLVEQLAKIEPKLVGLVVNNPQGYDFSQAAYNYLYNKKISPGSPEKFLSSQTPQKAQEKNDAEKGWIIYNKFSDAIDNELQRRGLSSTQQKGAEDLKALKEAVIRKLSIQTDPMGKPMFNEKTGQYVQTAWYNDYLDTDGSKTNKVILGLSQIINDPKFMETNKNNTTWKSVSVYLDFRSKIAQELANRKVKSIDAKSNFDVKQIYDGMVNKLKNDDKLGFSYLYDRFLSQDLIYDKYLTPKVEG